MCMEMSVGKSGKQYDQGITSPHKNLMRHNLSCSSTHNLRKLLSLSSLCKGSPLNTIFKQRKTIPKTCVPNN